MMKLNEYSVGDIKSGLITTYQGKEISKFTIEDGIVINNAVSEDKCWIADNHRDDVNISVNYDYDDIFQHIAAMFKDKPVVKHQCTSCGGSLTMDINNHLFKCPYCGTVYLLGTNQINAR